MFDIPFLWDEIAHCRYHVPDASVKLDQAYVEEPELAGGDGRRWEEERLHSAIFKPGAKDVKTKVV